MYLGHFLFYIGILFVFNTVKFPLFCLKDPSAQVTPTLFSDMYRALPQNLTERMKQELSCPMAFVALLHLCNEQNLELIKGADLTDFGISGPSGIH